MRGLTWPGSSPMIASGSWCPHGTLRVRRRDPIPGAKVFMLSIPTRTSVVLAALVALASVSVSSMPLLGAPAQRKDDKDKKPAEGLTAAQRQEAAPLAKLADEVMKGAAPGTYLVTPPKDPSKEPKEPVPSQPAPEAVT